MKVYIGQIKPKLADENYNLKLMLDVIDRAIEKGADIVAFPELALTGYLLEDAVFDVARRDVPEILLEKSKQISIIYGGVELGIEEYPYNSAYYLEDGRVLHTHRKVHLPTYRAFDEGRNFMAGDKIRAFDTKFGKIGMLVCEDVWHQSSQYILAQDGAKHIFVLFNSVSHIGAKKEDISKSWKKIFSVNSMLNGVYTIGINRVGVEDGITYFGNSFVTSPSGDVMIEGKYFDVDEFLVDLDIESLRRARFSSPMFKGENLNLVSRELSRIEIERFKK